MSRCVTHLYTGVFPCPWPRCPNGTFHDSFEHLGKYISRERFCDETGAEVYGWAIDTVASAYLLGQFARRSVLRLNAEPLPEDDGYLYHYTTADGLRGITESGELWLTDYRDFSDTEEIRHGLSIAKSVFAQLRHKLHSRTCSLLDVVLDDPLDSPTYVVCFCWQGESTYHWQEYARDETGGAIVLDPLGIGPLLETDIFGVQLTRVAYTLDAKELLFRQTMWWLDTFVRFDNGRRVFNQRFYLRELRQLLGEMLPLCKDVSFLREHEMRLIVSPSLSRQGFDDRVHAREFRGRRYITTRDIHRDLELPITEVIVGDRFAGDASSLLHRSYARRR